MATNSNVEETIVVPNESGNSNFLAGMLASELFPWACLGPSSIPARAYK